MDNLKHVIEQARIKKMDDAAIRSLLVKTGWDGEVVDAALKGVFVPLPPAADGKTHTTTRKASPDHGPHLSALEAAVHHVLLWFFTISLSITIGVVSATLFGTATSFTAVSSFLATSVITLIPYGFFYLRYLRRLRAEPDATTGKVWSIITIVLHSLIAMGGLIALVTVAINSSDNSLPILVASATIAIVNTLVVATYAHATFVDSTVRRRALLLRIFPIVVVLLLAGFIVASITKVGPLRADDHVRQDMVTAAEKIRDYTENSQALPATGKTADLGLPAGIEYERVSDTSYRLCGSFKTSGNGQKYSYDRNDSYTSTYDFDNKDPGRQCFVMNSQTMLNRNSDPNSSPTNKEFSQ